MTGEDCFVLKVCLPSIDSLDQVLDQFLAYGQTTTSFIQSTPVPPLKPAAAEPQHNIGQRARTLQNTKA